MQINNLEMEGIMNPKMGFTGMMHGNKEVTSIFEALKCSEEEEDAWRAWIDNCGDEDISKILKGRYKSFFKKRIIFVAVAPGIFTDFLGKNLGGHGSKFYEALEKDEDGSAIYYFEKDVVEFLFGLIKTFKNILCERPEVIRGILADEFNSLIFSYNGILLNLMAMDEDEGMDLAGEYDLDGLGATEDNRTIRIAPQNRFAPFQRLLCEEINLKHKKTADYRVRKVAMAKIPRYHGWSVRQRYAEVIVNSCHYWEAVMDSRVVVGEDSAKQEILFCAKQTKFLIGSLVGSSGDIPKMMAESLMSLFHFFSERKEFEDLAKKIGRKFLLNCDLSVSNKITRVAREMLSFVNEENLSDLMETKVAASESEWEKKEDEALNQGMRREKEIRKNKLNRESAMKVLRIE